MDSLRIYCVTWNIATRNPEEDLHALLSLSPIQNTDRPPDLYVIGLQEVKSQPQNIIFDILFDDPWTLAIKDILSLRDYVKVKSIRLQGLLLCIFSLRKHLLHIRDIQTQFTRTGLGGFWGNKGAVSIRLVIYGCSVCFLNCHFTPHDNMNRHRIMDYNTVIKNHVYDTRDTTNILYHDYVFWIGDLNFRLNDFSASDINSLIREEELPKLLEKDQLLNAMDQGEAFSELTEGLLKFKPTYKYDFGTSSYDLKRRPAWTDRILYKVNAHVYENLTLNVRVHSYRSIDHYCQSDHKPVIGEFSIKVFSNYYERIVDFLPIQTWLIDEDNKCNFIIGRDVEPTAWDWIGLFKDGFGGLDEYISYVYISSPQTCNDEDVRSSQRMRCVTFPDSSVRTPGRYRLLYFSNSYSCVLGMSDSFAVCYPDRGHSIHYGGI